MIPRVLEPEAMDTSEEAAEYDAMDHSGVNDRFVADFLSVHGFCRMGTILDVGTGTALIPIELCRVDPIAQILAVDLAEAMLEVGRRNVQDAGFADRIRLERVDAKQIGYKERSFEAVISNSIVHHIPDPQPVLAEMARLVASGGTVFVRDLARPRWEDDLQRIVATYAAQESPRARALFADSLRAALTLEEVQVIVQALGCPPQSVAMTSDRHWTWSWSP